MIINLKEMLLERQVNQSERLGCLMAMVDEDTSKKIINFGKRIITDDDLYHEINEAGEDEYGREGEIHTTVRYGFTKDLNELEIRQLLKGQKSFLIELVGLDKFTTNPNYDVVKFNVKSDILNKLNESSKAYPNKSDFPIYHPHITLGYVKKGKFPYIKEGLKLKIPISEICYSPISGAKSYFPLNDDNLNEVVTFPKIDAKIKELEQEWERLDSTGTGSVRQQEISREIERLNRIKEPRQKLNPDSSKVKSLWSNLHNSI